MSGPGAGLPGRVRPIGPNLVRVGLLLVAAFVVLAAGAGYWQVVVARPLSVAPDNPAVQLARRSVVRGQILDRTGRVLARNATDKQGLPYRVYPDDSVSPLLGYASRYYGTAGVERAYDAQLSGVASGDPVYDVVRKFEGNPYDPADLTLTLSLPLQQRAVAELGGDVGAVAMLDPTNGQLLALASTPTFDATGIASPDQATARSAWQKTQANGDHPLIDRALQGLYTPGSVFKIVTSLAALGSGKITPATTFADQPAEERTGFLVSGYRVVDAHHPWTDGTALDYGGAVENSCNIYFAHVGLLVGGDGLRQWADSVGFDAPLPLDLPTTPSTLNDGKGTFGGGFKDSVDLANAAYGQAEVVTTPLQMALVAATVANRGELMKPYLVLSSKTRSGTRTTSPERWRDVIAPDQADVIAKAMQQAVEGRFGRIFTAGAKIQGIPTAGKSGTAQLDGSAQPHSWFIGFAPVDNPRVAIAVIVENGGSGSGKASPIAGRLMTYYLKTLQGSRSPADGGPAAVAEPQRAGVATDIVADRPTLGPEVPSRG